MAKSKTAESKTESKLPEFVSVEHFSEKYMNGNKRIKIVKSKGFTKETNEYLGVVTGGGMVLDGNGKPSHFYIIADGRTFTVDANMGEDILIEYSIGDSDLRYANR